MLPTVRHYLFCKSSGVRTRDLQRDPKTIKMSKTEKDGTDMSEARSDSKLVLVPAVAVPTLTGPHDSTPSHVGGIAEDYGIAYLPLAKIKTLEFVVVE